MSNLDEAFEDARWALMNRVRELELRLGERHGVNLIEDEDDDEIRRVERELMRRYQRSISRYMPRYQRRPTRNSSQERQSRRDDAERDPENGNPERHLGNENDHSPVRMLEIESPERYPGTDAAEIHRRARLYSPERYRRPIIDSPDRYPALDSPEGYDADMDSPERSPGRDSPTGYYDTDGPYRRSHSLERRLRLDSHLVDRHPATLDILSGEQELTKDKLGKGHTQSGVRPPCYTGFQYLTSRQYGHASANPYRFYRDRLPWMLPYVLEDKEREFKLGTINKIFASQWLNDKKVVFGTKCNQLIVMDVPGGQQTVIPTLQSSQESVPAQQPCGIHGISINPSRTMLATGASNTNDIGVYRLPTFDPHCVGEGAHSDWVFDMEWLDDEFLITGSRDNNLAIWKIEDSIDESHTSCRSCLYVPEYAVKKPVAIKNCDRAQKVRALSINRDKKEMAVLSLNAYFHLFDLEQFKQIWSCKLGGSRENVCMSVSEARNVYVIGSHTSITLVDSRIKAMDTIHACPQVTASLLQGVRSVSFNRDMVTIGTGTGAILFFDLRASKFLKKDTNNAAHLRVGRGWLKEDSSYRDHFMGYSFTNAIYTHAYDEAGVRLFAAGGPLAAGLWGNYAGLWV